ncbi:MAG: right-handed parallel beta-helix repeat-containing protein [Acidobacteria bacterium]|nr:right-handed parallel beta-helix repeat-containing protein [Acidobacteriota bacterium]
MNRRTFLAAVTVGSQTAGKLVAGDDAASRPQSPAPRSESLQPDLYRRRMWYAGGPNASDSNAGTAQRPVKTVAKAVSLARPGDVVIFAPGVYPCLSVKVPDGAEDLPIILRSDGRGKAIFINDGTQELLLPGWYNTIDGLEFHMTSSQPKGHAIQIERKRHVIIRNCRFYACRMGVIAFSTHYLRITNCEMAYSGVCGIDLVGSGRDIHGQWDPADENRYVEIRNCYLHDAGWGVAGTEGHGINVAGAMEFLSIENCQIDNNSGDGILYEDWAIHATARYNVIRGTGIAAVWIDNATMNIFESNYLEANNVAVWLSGEESSNRHLDDFIAIRNNIIVHNDWSAISPSVYGRQTLLITSNTRDVYFDNNTVAFNNSKRVVGFENRPPWNQLTSIWFRNNIFWENTGPVGADPGLDINQFHFVNNLWDKPYPGDREAKVGNPLFVDPNAHNPEGYKLQAGSAARGQGMLLYENPVDFWNGFRPHLSKSKKYDIGAHQYGTRGAAHIGLDLATFPYEVPPFKLQFKAKPKL